MMEPVDPRFMQRAIDLALLGGGRVAPNPLVGCVIVNEGRIIGQGYHHEFGGPHAEVIAIGSVRNKDLLNSSTLYVTLEPCAHFGKTPPCANLIIESKIPRVIVGCLDPFPAVDGRGIEKLRQAEIEVVTDVLRDECRWLNRRFFTYHERKRPYVVLKWAQTSDGFMDIDRSQGQRGSIMFSSADTQLLVHRWRSEEVAIVIGKNTFLNDNPALTVRRLEGKNPLRVLLSSQPIDIAGSHLASSEAPTWVLTDSVDKQQGAIRYLSCGDVRNPDLVLERLYRENVLSIFVEGGALVLHTFLKSGLWDEARVITAHKTIGAGLLAPRLSDSPYQEEESSSDIIRYFKNPV